MNIVKHVKTGPEFLLWSRKRHGVSTHVLYDIDGQIICDFGSEMPQRHQLQAVLKAWQTCQKKG